MAKPKEGKTKDGTPMHFSVGALIERDGQYLLIDRAVPPFGFAGVAGHIDDGEDEEIVERKAQGNIIYLWRTHLEEKSNWKFLYEEEEIGMIDDGLSVLYNII